MVKPGMAFPSKTRRACGALTPIALDLVGRREQPRQHHFHVIRRRARMSGDGGADGKIGHATAQHQRYGDAGNLGRYIRPTSTRTRPARPIRCPERRRFRSAASWPCREAASCEPAPLRVRSRTSMPGRRGPWRWLPEGSSIPRRVAAAPAKCCGRFRSTASRTRRARQRRFADPPHRRAPGAPPWRFRGTSAASAKRRRMARSQGPAGNGCAVHPCRGSRTRPACRSGAPLSKAAACTAARSGGCPGTPTPDSKQRSTSSPRTSEVM